MPELTIEYCYTCPSNISWAKEIVGSKGDKYLVTYGWEHDWACTCPAFQYHRDKYCKHIKAAYKERCGWNWESVTGVKGEPKEGPTGKLCPMCGEEVEIVKVGV